MVLKKMGPAGTPDLETKTVRECRSRGPARLAIYQELAPAPEGDSLALGIHCYSGAPLAGPCTMQPGLAGCSHHADLGLILERIVFHFT